MGVLPVWALLKLQMREDFPPRTASSSRTWLRPAMEEEERVLFRNEPLE
jgi:hypothetical protein